MDPMEHDHFKACETQINLLCELQTVKTAAGGEAETVEPTC